MHIIKSIQGVDTNVSHLSVVLVVFCVVLFVFYLSKSY